MVKLDKAITFSKAEPKFFEPPGLFFSTNFSNRSVYSDLNWSFSSRKKFTSNILSVIDMPKSLCLQMCNILNLIIYGVCELHNYGLILVLFRHLCCCKIFEEKNHFSRFRLMLWCIMCKIRFSI